MNHRMSHLIRTMSALLLLPAVALAHLDPSSWRIVDVSSDNLVTGEQAEHAIDGNPETQWHTQWHSARDVEAAKPPHFITIDFQASHPVSAIRVRARAHGEGGVPRQYTMELSPDGHTWRTVAEGNMAFRSTLNAHAVVTLAQPVPARFLRFTVVSVQPSDRQREPGLAVSEIDVATVKSPLVPTTLLPVPQSREWNYGGYVWRTRHQDLLTYAAEHRPRLIFLGDSITHRWGAEPCHVTPRTGQSIWTTYYGHRNAISLGYGWDRLENMLWRLQHGELTQTDPRLVVVMAGTNNLEVNTAREIALGVAGLCDEIHAQKPQARILLLAIFPRGSDYQTNTRLHQTNDLISKLGERDYIQFKDIGAVFLDAQGQVIQDLMPDSLHPNEAGYRLWAQAIESEVSLTLDDSPVTAGSPAGN
ncbi:MAG: discoidin domain-containing protein [Phycisphaerae bacterium]|nr:discoidin domain-containing protein [Phycisphaerae bacterium]